MVFGNSIIPYPVRSYLFFVTKKCRIYAACGVSQTPIKVKNCEAVSKSKKLLRFTLDDGTENERTILSGVHAFYEPEELVGKTLLAIVNLSPRSMMGIDSCGMLLSAIHNVNGEEKLNLVMLDDSIPAGAKLY